MIPIMPPPTIRKSAVAGGGPESFALDGGRANQICVSNSYLGLMPPTAADLDSMNSKCIANLWLDTAHDEHVSRVCEQTNWLQWRRSVEPAPLA